MRSLLNMSLLMIATVTGCNVSEADGVSNAQSRTADAHEVAKSMGIAIPPTAVVEYVEQMHGMDYAARLILSMPEKTWEQWRADIPPAGSAKMVFSTENNDNLDFDVGNWGPKKTDNLTSATVRWRNSQSLTIGQMPIGGGRVRIYIWYFET